MLSVDGKTWKLIDFGLAVAKQSSISRSTLPGLKQGTGTAFYQAPELLQGNDAAFCNHMVDGGLVGFYLSSCVSCRVPFFLLL